MDAACIIDLTREFMNDCGYSDCGCGAYLISLRIKLVFVNLRATADTACIRDLVKRCGQRVFATRETNAGAACKDRGSVSVKSWMTASTICVRDLIERLPDSV